jgi:hypothetical protein
MAIYQTLIQTQTVGAGGVAEIIFSSIPQTFTDLKVVMNARLSNSALANTMYMGFNGAYTLTTSRYLASDGTALTSSAASTPFIGDVSANSATANTFGSIEVYIPNYTSANFKQYISDSVSENNATTAYTELWAGLWRSTSAVTSLNFAGSGVTMLQNTIISLYGIKNS